MQSRLMRYAVPLPLFLMALLNAWFVFRIAANNIEAIRHYTRVPGEVQGWDEGALLRVKLLPPGADYWEAETIDIKADSTVLMSGGEHVTVYVNPADKSKSRLGGIRMWWAPFVLCLASILVFGPAYFLVRLDRPFGWEYGTPAPWSHNPADLSARYARSGLRAWLFWGTCGLAVAIGGYFLPDVALLKRVTIVEGGLCWFFAFVVWACHMFTFRISANQEGLKASSILAWKAVRWDRVKAIERRAGGGINLPELNLSWLVENILSRLQSVRFADGHGETLLRISSQVFGSIPEILQLAGERTGLERGKNEAVPDFDA